MEYGYHDNYRRFITWYTRGYKLNKRRYYGQNSVEILKFIGNQNSIKVVGSIKTLTQVVDLFDSGIDCIGTSNFNEIFKEIRLI